jgi:hypothetical protein
MKEVGRSKVTLRKKDGKGKLTLLYIGDGEYKRSI